MEKPIDLLIVDMKGSLKKFAYDSKLPLSIIEMIFKEATNEISAELNANLPLIKNQYEQSLKKENEKDKVKEDKNK